MDPTVNTDKFSEINEKDGPDKAFTLFASMFMFVIVTSLFGVGAGDQVQSDGGSSIFRQVTWLFVGVVVIFKCISFNRKLVFDFVPSGGFFASLLLLIYCVSSFYWSAISLVTLKRAILFSLMVMVCFASFGRKSGNPARFLPVLAWPLGLLLVLSFVYTAISPGSAITSIGWRGITSFKNEFGQLCAIALLVFSFGFFEFKHKKLSLFMAMLSFFGLVMSQSSTCAVAVVIGMGCGLGLLFIRRMSKLKLPSAFLLCFCMMLCFIMLALVVCGVVGGVDDTVGKIFHLLGKSSTLTGRTKLWALMQDNMRLHNPWIGGGYGGFWDGLGSPANFTAYRFPAGYVGQAHNGYIDLLNDLGYVGIFMLVLILLIFFVEIARKLKYDDTEIYFHLSFFVFIILENYAESTFFRLVVFLNIIFFSCLARVSTGRNCRGGDD